MTDPVKLAKLIYKLREITLCLSTHKNLAIHQHVSQFFYMEKITELNELREQIMQATKRIALLTEQLDREYETTFMQWRKDVRYLNHYFHFHIAIK